MFQNFDTEAKQSEATQNIKAAESKKKTKKKRCKQVLQQKHAKTIHCEIITE